MTVKTRLGSYSVGLAVMLMLSLFCVPAMAQNRSEDAKPALKAAAATAEAGQRVFTGEIWDSVDAQRGSRDQMMKENGLGTPLTATIFAVRYLKPPAKYVLYDPGTKKIYQIDDQNRVGAWATAKVKITGTLDEASNTIHLTDIVSGL